MKSENLHYRPSLDPNEIGNRLSKLLATGPICDRDLERRICRLGERFRVYAARSPHGLWAPGLAVTREMEATSELYLPLEEIGRALRRLFALSLNFEPFLPATPLHTVASWPGFLHRLQPPARDANPARLLHRLAADGEFRTRFLFSLFLPRRYGGGFGRYPGQAAFLREWLAANRPERVRCLDAACGSGEGTYELALLLLEAELSPERIELHGTTVEPLELFAAAHGWFPHDPARQEAYRARIRRVFTGGADERVIFYREDLTVGGRAAGDGYDLVLCNGLLGGPLLSGAEKLAGAVGGLCARLGPGGLFMAADRFHEGWKRSVPAGELREMLADNGLEPLDVEEGVAGVKR